MVNPRNPSDPIEVFCKSFRFCKNFYGFISIEDRRPDLPNYSGKYKTVISIRFFKFFYFSYLVRSDNAPFVMVGNNVVLE